MKNLTTEQTNHELTRIRRNALTLNEYIRTSRVGETFRMSRADREEVYALYIAELNNIEDKKTSMKMRRLSSKGAFAYDTITKHRDEVMLVTA